MKSLILKEEHLFGRVSDHGLHLITALLLKTTEFLGVRCATFTPDIIIDFSRALTNRNGTTGRPVVLVIASTH